MVSEKEWGDKLEYKTFREKKCNKNGSFRETDDSVENVTQKEVVRSNISIEIKVYWKISVLILYFGNDVTYG